ncbi:hypothetical protein DYQ86_13985 [Acidobacteria bacterium AB60]|nr:hypothetical protein DYQ86_13985 [Acidobacteria bacterium AB60]
MNDHVVKSSGLRRIRRCNHISGFVANFHECRLPEEAGKAGASRRPFFTSSLLHFFTSSLLHFFTSSLLHFFTSSLLHFFTDH